MKTKVFVTIPIQLLTGQPVPAEAARIVGGDTIDHDTPWTHGGTTNLANLRPLCPRDHRHRHRTKTHYRTRDDHTIEITTPTGHTTTPPPF